MYFFVVVQCSQCLHFVRSFVFCFWCVSVCISLGFDDNIQLCLLYFPSGFISFCDCALLASIQPFWRQWLCAVCLFRLAVLFFFFFLNTIYKPIVSMSTLENTFKTQRWFDRMRSMLVYLLSLRNDIERVLLWNFTCVLRFYFYCFLSSEIN